MMSVTAFFVAGGASLRPELFRAVLAFFADVGGMLSLLSLSSLLLLLSS